MGTRLYAEAIAKVIDVNKSLFSNRILSRDESGSFEFKSLERLFPHDHSMVVVVDDRGDVWKRSDNLIQVIPCNTLFFSLHLINQIDILLELVTSMRQRVQRMINQRKNLWNRGMDKGLN